MSDGLEGMRLADDPFLELGSEIEYGLDLVGQHLADGDARPAGDNLGDGLGIDADLHQRGFALELAKFAGLGLELGLHGGQLRRGLERLAVAGVLGPLLPITGLNFLCQGPDFLHPFPLVFPPQFELGQSRLLLFQLLLQSADPLVVRRAGGTLALQDADLDAQVINLAAAVFDSGGNGVLADRDAGAGGIEQADRLVGKLPCGDVTVRQLDGALDGLFEDSHSVVLLENSGEPAHHANGHIFTGFLDLDHLEPPGEGRILLEILLVFGPGGGGDGSQLTASQGRLEQVGGIPLPGRSAGPDHGMRLVDEENDRRGRALHLGDDLLEPVLELSLDPGAGLEQAKVEGANGDVLERRGNVTLGDPPRQTLDDGRLAHSGLTGQDRVVLAATDQDIDHLAHFGLTADDRIDLPLPGTFGEIDGELVEGRRLGHARGMLAGRGSGSRCPGIRPGRSLILARTSDQAHQVRLKQVGLDLAELTRGVARETPQLFVVEQCQQQRPRPHLTGLELDRSEHPGSADQLVDLE